MSGSGHAQKYTRCIHFAGSPALPAALSSRMYWNKKRSLDVMTLSGFLAKSKKKEIEFGVRPDMERGFQGSTQIE